MPSSDTLRALQNRVHGENEARPGDVRDAFRRDKARIIHSAAFRRLQGKTQVMGVGEGDFHRTRLTHSIEAAQIGEGILNRLKKANYNNELRLKWLPPSALVEAACLAHDLGHPPFGHGGEKALHGKIWSSGGFEGNGQTLRILVKLEKYQRNEGINPTFRTVLSVLKYAIPYSRYSEEIRSAGPPKCYFSSEEEVVQRALEIFPQEDSDAFQKLMKPAGKKPDVQLMTLDAAIMEAADDIAYAVHDLEDIVARKMVERSELEQRLKPYFCNSNHTIVARHDQISLDDILDKLFDGWSGNRKQAISRLVNFFIVHTDIEERKLFTSPLLDLSVGLPDNVNSLLKALKTVTYELVVNEPGVQHLERRGQRVVSSLFDEFMSGPERMIPKSAWDDLDRSDTTERKICDYIAGMTDGYAQKIYQRLFTPGFGSSSDEL